MSTITTYETGLSPGTHGARGNAVRRRRRGARVPTAPEVVGLETNDVTCASSPSRMSVETLRSSWQAAFDAADDALRSAVACLPPAELRQRSAALAAERDPIERLLQGLAEDRHCRAPEKHDALVSFTCSQTDRGADYYLSSCRVT